MLRILSRSLDAFEAGIHVCLQAYAHGSVLTASQILNALERAALLTSDPQLQRKLLVVGLVRVASARMLARCAAAALAGPTPPTLPSLPTSNTQLVCTQTTHHQTQLLPMVIGAFSPYPHVATAPSGPCRSAKSGTICRPTTIFTGVPPCAPTRTSRPRHQPLLATSPPPPQPHSGHSKQHTHAHTKPMPPTHNNTLQSLTRGLPTRPPPNSTSPLCVWDWLWGSGMVPPVGAFRPPHPYGSAFVSTTDSLFESNPHTHTQPQRALLGRLAVRGVTDVPDTDPRDVAALLLEHSLYRFWMPELRIFLNHDNGNQSQDADAPSCSHTERHAQSRPWLPFTVLFAYVGAFGPCCASLYACFDSAQIARRAFLFLAPAHTQVSASPVCSHCPAVRQLPVLYAAVELSPLTDTDERSNSPTGEGSQPGASDMYPGGSVRSLSCASYCTCPQAGPCECGGLSAWRRGVRVRIVADFVGPEFLSLPSSVADEIADSLIGVVLNKIHTALSPSTRCPSLTNSLRCARIMKESLYKEISIGLSFFSHHPIKIRQCN